MRNRPHISYRFLAAAVALVLTLPFDASAVRPELVEGRTACSGHALRQTIENEQIKRQLTAGLEEDPGEIAGRLLAALAKEPVAPSSRVILLTLNRAAEKGVEELPALGKDPSLMKQLHRELDRALASTPPNSNRDPLRSRNWETAAPLRGGGIRFIRIYSGLVGRPSPFSWEESELVVVEALIEEMFLQGKGPEHNRIYFFLHRYLEEIFGGIGEAAFSDFLRAADDRSPNDSKGLWDIVFPILKQAEQLTEDADVARLFQEEAYRLRQESSKIAPSAGLEEPRPVEFEESLQDHRALAAEP